MNSDRRLKALLLAVCASSLFALRLFDFGQDRGSGSGDDDFDTPEHHFNTERHLDLYRWQLCPLLQTKSPLP